MSEPLTAEPAVAVERAPFWEDVVDIYTSPRAVFERRREAPYIPALVTLTLAMTLLTVAFQLSMGDAMFAAMRQSIEASGAELPAEQIAQMQRISMFTAPLGALIMTPIAAVVTGLMVWGLGAVLGARMTFRAGVLIAAFSAFPRIISMIVSIFQGVLLDPLALHHVSISPARFIAIDGSPLLVAALGRLDLFVLWSTALVAIGVATIARTSSGRAWAVALIVWALSALPLLVGPLTMAMNQ
ncbi:MAG TPA: YIP1 family protein [Longimicrobiales bacterium]|nr:YIP1 family protein [Longimicrobiales bacterium]